MSHQATGAQNSSQDVVLATDPSEGGPDRTSGLAPEAVETFWWCGDLADLGRPDAANEHASGGEDAPSWHASVRPPSGGGAASEPPQAPAEPPTVQEPPQDNHEEPLDASAFSSEQMLRRSVSPPGRGWRRAVFNISGGAINPAPSARQVEHLNLLDRIRNPIQDSRRIAVISRKGGVGKTTTTLMLGHTFATWRGDRVIALDGNPDAGSLGYRVRRETKATITDLLNDAPRLTRYADVRGYTSQAPSRLEVIASDDDDAITLAMGEDELADAIRLAERHYNLILLDTGTGILDSATQGILRMADQIVIVTVPSLDGARASSLTLDWLEHNGYDWLVQNAVAALNQSHAGTLVDVERVRSHFERRCRATVVMPWDPHLQAGAESDLAAVRPPTRRAYLELAAAVADGFRGVVK